jgi:glutathione peroxidase
MAGLQVLEEQFSGQGFHVLGFYSNDFNQAGNDGQIDQCTSDYQITFPQFAVGHVKDVDGSGPLEPQPVWQWILSQPQVGPAPSLVPSWNFNKYLVSRSGELVAHWSESVYPGDNPQNANDSFDTNPIVVAIRAELAK